LLQPIQWNRGGYDAIIVDKSQKLRTRFVSVSAAANHDLKLQYHHAFLNIAKEVTETFKVEIVFVVPIIS